MRVIETVSPFEGGRGGGEGGNSVRNSILPMYFLSHGTKNRCKKILFFGYNQARTCARTRPHLCSRANNFFRRLFPASFFLPPLHSSPLHSFRFLHFFPTLERGAEGGGGGREIHDMHCFLQEKQWGCFCANDGRRGEARRGEAPVSLVSGGSLLKAKQTFSQSQPLWRSNNRFALPSSWPEKLERNRRIRLFDRNARRGRDWKGRLEKKTRQKRVFLQEREKEISFMNGFMNGA